MSPPTGWPAPSIVSVLSGSLPSRGEQDEGALFDHLRAAPEKGEDIGDDPTGPDTHDEWAEGEGDDEQDAGEDQAGEEDDSDSTDQDDLHVVALPVLSEDVMSDHDALDLALSEVVEVSSAARQVQAEIDRLHEVLQGVLEPVHFATILQVEQLGQARLGVLLPLVAAWAWAEGRQAGREEG